MTERKYRTLDGLRGVAALCIVCLHANRFFGDLAPAAQMAVDLFFVLSGFVLAHAYGRRLEDGLSPLRFLLLRYARLYPMYLLGTLLGVAIAVLSIHYRQGAMEWTWPSLWASVPFGLFMVPNPLAVTPFPLDGVMWSIFFELIANALWALTWRRLRSARALVSVIICFGLLFSIAAYQGGSTGLGPTWSTFFGGLARVGYSFFLGVLLYRIHRSLAVPRVPPLLLLAVLPVLSALPLTTTVQLLCALVVFPMLVLLGSQTEPAGMLEAFCRTTGAASYAVYALHKRVYLLTYAALLQFFGFQAERYAPWIGFAFLLLLVPVCGRLTRGYEDTARRALTRVLARRPFTRHAPPAKDPSPAR